MATAPELADALSEAHGGCVAVILDLSELEFMDSTGLQTILSAHARLAEAGCRLVLIPDATRYRRSSRSQRRNNTSNSSSLPTPFDRAKRPGYRPDGRSHHRSSAVGAPAARDA
jgi:hypothetical protein